jgi:hypothetical protein
METALETAKWLLGQVLNKLSDDLVKAYVSSTELGPNLDKIKTEMLSTNALLVAAQRRDVTGNPALQGLLEMLGKKAKEAENTLHELHHFMTRDKIDGTRYAAPELGDGLGAKAEHAHHAARHTADNWLSCLSCCCRRDDDDDDAAHAMPRRPRDDGHVAKLPFNRVAMSNKIRQLIEEMHSYCTRISNVLDEMPSRSRDIHTPDRNLGIPFQEKFLYIKAGRKRGLICVHVIHSDISRRIWIQ